MTPFPEPGPDLYIYIIHGFEKFSESGKLLCFLYSDHDDF